MKKGVPTLNAPHTLCVEGKVLSAEQAQLLKLIGEKMVEFRVGLKAWWSAETGQVVQVDDPAFDVGADETVAAAAGDDEDAEGEEDEAMSD